LAGKIYLSVLLNSAEPIHFAGVFTVNINLRLKTAFILSSFIF